jgi:hypothetical protein
VIELARRMLVAPPFSSRRSRFPRVALSPPRESRRRAAVTHVQLLTAPTRHLFAPRRCRGVAQKRPSLALAGG